MAVAVAVVVAVSGGGAVAVAVPVAGLTKRFFNHIQKDFRDPKDTCFHRGPFFWDTLRPKGGVQ